MPIIPAFDPSTGASGGPSGGGGGGAAPIWLNVPTQVVQLGGSSTGAITLSTPTNGTGPYSYRVLSYGNNDQTRTLIVSGNVLEVNNTPSFVTWGQGASGIGYRVLVWDSLGNFGVGVLLIYQDPTWTSEILGDVVLDYDQSTDGYLFAGPRNLPAGWTFGTSYAPAGDGFSYPIAFDSATSIGDRFANCAPGSFVALMYRTVSPSSVSQINFLILRRKLDMANLHWSWAKTFDLIDWNNLSAWSPTVPLTNTALATVVETIASTSKSYNMDRRAATVTAGLAPTLETATISGGVATLETQNTAASTRVISMSFRPGPPNTSQTYREGTFGASVALLARMKVAVTITGDAASADIRLGRDFTPSSGAGIRIAGTTNTVGGQPGVRISFTRSSFLISQGTFRKSVWGGGTPFGLDIIFVGGNTWVCAYPWDNSWTDYPEWDPYVFQPKAENLIGPSMVGDRASANAVNSPYPFGSNFPIDTTGGSIATFSTNNGVNIGVTQGNTANNGAKVVVENFQYYWSSANMGVVR